MDFRVDAAQSEHRVFVTALNLRRMTSWLLASTILCYASTGLSSSAFAQQPATGQTRAIQFSIPAQPLPAAINAFIRATGWQVGYSTRITDGRRSAAVNGTMPAAQALRTLLAGTGINVTLNGVNTATLVAPNAAVGNLPDGAIPLETIDVQGGGQQGLTPEYAGGQVATGGQLGMLGNTSVMDTPFNQTSYTSKYIQNSQSATVPEVLQDNPSVRTIVNGAGTQYYEQLSIRGFNVSAMDYTYGGMPGLLPYLSPGVGIAERIEVLNGPSALLNGMPASGAIGGTVNFVPKRAGDTPLTEFNTFFRSNGTLGEHIDIGRRFGPNNEFGVRFNGVYNAGETSVSDQINRFGLAVVGLDYRGERVRLSADFGHQENRIKNATITDFSVLAGIPIPPAPSGRDLAAAPWSYSNSVGTFGIVRGEFDITNDLTVYAAYGANRSRFDTTTPVYHTILDTTGLMEMTPVNIRMETEQRSAQAGLRYRFDTGWATHRIVVQADRYTQSLANVSAYGDPFETNFYNPSFSPAPTIVTPVINKPSEYTLWGASAAYSLSLLDERIILTGGARKQDFNYDAYNARTGVLTSSYKTDALSPAVALVVKPWKNVSIYANYIEGLSPGIVVPAPYRNAGEVLPAFQSKQLEGGIKIDWGRITTTLSAFEITRPQTAIAVYHAL